MKNTRKNDLTSDNVERISGMTARIQNIRIAKELADAISSTLGPRGLDKLIVDPNGNVVVTNDGVTILREMQIEHPVGKMIVEIAKQQEATVGDGTTSTVILAGQLLEKAEGLIAKGIHPTIIARGYRMAERRAQEVLQDIAQPITIHDVDLLKKIIHTAMTGKGAESSSDFLAELIIKAVQYVGEESQDGTLVDLENIKVTHKEGKSVNESIVVDGIILEKERAHPSMPKEVKHAVVALLSSELSIGKTTLDAKIQITDPNQIHTFLEKEREEVDKIAETIDQLGVKALFCEKGIDDTIVSALAERSILAIKRVPRGEMEMLARATGTLIHSDWKSIKGYNLGSAGLIREESFGKDRMLFVKECLNPKAVTIFVRGGTEHIAEEVRRAVEDSLGDVASALRNGKVVAGAGSCEMILSEELKRYAETIEGKEQFSIIAFAESMESIPHILAENAGLDAIEILTKLRAAHKQEGNEWMGVDVFSGTTMDAWRRGVIEPLEVKTLALSSAMEVAEMILRIDDVFLGNVKRVKEPSEGI